MPMAATPGTHRIALTVTRPGGKHESWPVEFDPEILQPVSLQPLAIIVREVDDPPGRMTELLGLPFVETPRPIPLQGHPTDLRLGVNCAGLAIYGQRRMGARLPYMMPPALRRYTTLIASYSGEAPVATSNLPVRRGDLLHFGFQVAVLLEDRGRIGFLDPEDLVIHAYHAGVEELPYSRLPYRDLPFTIRRWR